MTHVLNPKSNRMIRVGGKPWRTLVKEGIISNNPVGDSVNTNKTLFIGSTIEEAKAKKASLGKQDPKKNKFFGRRGSKIVEILRTPKQEEIAEYTAKCASRTLHKHIDELTESIEDAYEDLDDNTIREFEENLKNLILEEMISGNANKPANRNIRGNRRYAEPDTDYELESLRGDTDTETDIDE